MDMNDLRAECSRMKALQERKAIAEEDLTQINKALDELRLNILPKMAEELGVTNVKFDGIGRLQFASDLYASTKAGKKDEAMQWLRDCGYEDMISETYNASSIKALFRRMITDQGMMPPEDIFAVTPFTRASLVKA